MGATTVKNGEAFKKFIEQAKKIDGSYVSIGVHEDAGQYKDGQSVVEVALWNEFGTDHIPERSWMRSTIDDNSQSLNKLREKLLYDVQDGKISIDKALATLGFRIQILLQNKIGSNIEPENSPATKAYKKKEGFPQRTLEETKLLLRSVTYKVNLK